MVDSADGATLNAQNTHWEKTYIANPDNFGVDPSEPAKYAATLFRSEGKRGLLELGAGQGRDTLFFAHEGFQVQALDYSDTGLSVIRKKALAQALAPRITAQRHDVRQPLPFEQASLEACYAHMLF